MAHWRMVWMPSGEPSKFVGFFEFFILLAVIILVVGSFIFRWKRLEERGKLRLRNLLRPERNSDDL